MFLQVSLRPFFAAGSPQVGQRELVPRSSTAKKAMPRSSARYLTASRVDARIQRAVVRF
jgi:hypothetical protein